MSTRIEQPLERVDIYLRSNFADVSEPQNEGEYYSFRVIVDGRLRRVRAHKDLERYGDNLDTFLGKFNLAKRLHASNVELGDIGSSS